MSLESDVFSRRQADFKSLLEYGFVQTDNTYTYSEVFMDGDFRADVTVDASGNVSGRVYDLIADEEYLPIHIEDRIGAFVGAVRDAYTDILERIAQSCFKEKLFIFGQSNRIAGLILEKYNESADFPFSKVTDAAVFRYPKNRKWYGLIMPVKRSVLTKQADDEKDTVEIINLKADESKRDEILKINGIYPAYHMNHEKWISVVLDDTVSDKMLMQLIDESRNFAVGKRKK